MHPAGKLPKQLSAPGEYETALAAEVRRYERCLDIHDLPPIFHYWSTRHILPALRALGVAGPADFFLRNLTGRRFVSLGSGNCDLEISLARALCDTGRGDFVIECVDLNEAMLDRGRTSARQTGVEAQLSFVKGDLNEWSPRSEYDVVLANQSLHHVLNLEGLFAGVKRSLAPDGRFVISDIIGRNGHLRWPEALDIVQEFWRTLPPSYRWNRRAGRYEELFADHDCSGEGFEGVRAQDILPLLLDGFHFQFFFPFGNAIDPFVDRSFGANFDPARDCDRSFIDRVHARDELRIASGEICPTHMMAVVSAEPGDGCVYAGHLSPAFCLRPPAKSKRTVVFPGRTYQWQAQAQHWQTSAQGELERACGLLAESARTIEKQTAWALSLEREAALRLTWARDLERELDERLEWARGLDRDVRARTEWALGLRDEVSNRTEWIAALESWAAGLQADVEERTLWAQRLEKELDERTRWALRLQADLDEQTACADTLSREARGYIRNPFRLLFRMAAAIGRRMSHSPGR